MLYATEKTEENYFSVKNSIQNFEIVNPINAHCHVQVRFNKSRPCMSQQKQITKKQENIDFDLFIHICNQTILSSEITVGITY